MKVFEYIDDSPFDTKDNAYSICTFISEYLKP